MKKTILAALLLISAIVPLAAQRTPKAVNIYNKYSDETGVSAVYISPAMFRLIGKVPDINVNGEMDLSPIIKSLKGMYVLDCENPEVAGRLRKDVRKYMNEGSYELLLETKENGETTRIFTLGNEKIINSFVLLTDSGPETTFISFEGEIPRDKLEKAVASAASE